MHEEGRLSIELSLGASRNGEGIIPGSDLKLPTSPDSPDRVSLALFPDTFPSWDVINKDVLPLAPFSDCVKPGRKGGV